MYKVPVRILLIPIILFAVCCSGEEEPARDDKLVVEGWIEAGSGPVVMLSASLSPSAGNGDGSELQNHVIKWAKVTVSDGENSAVLVGKYAKGYFPPYIYTSGRIIGEAGKTYNLEVEYEGFHASAVTTIPAAVGLDDVSVEPQEGSGHLYTIKAMFRDPAAEKNYYRFFTRVEGRDSTYVPCFLGVFDDADLQTPATVTVNQGRSLNHIECKDTGFPGGQTIHVKFCTMDEAAYRFWSDFDKMTSLSDSPIFSSRFSLRSNITGGIGCWVGYGAAYYTVKTP